MSLWSNSYLLLLCGLFILPSPASSATTEQHLYTRTTGSQSELFSWRLERGEQLRLVSELAKERDVTRFDENLATSTWSVKDPTSNTDLRAQRKGEQLLLNGLFKGKKISRTESLGAAPWYQALSVSLRQFIHPGQTQIEFWTIRPDTLDLHKMQVKVAANEQITLQGQTVDTLKLKISLTGLSAHFWSCYYWLRKSDGLFVRYEGPSGPPGWPATVIELDDYASASPSGHRQQPAVPDNEYFSRL